MWPSQVLALHWIKQNSPLPPHQVLFPLDTSSSSWLEPHAMFREPKPTHRTYLSKQSNGTRYGVVAVWISRDDNSQSIALPRWSLGRPHGSGAETPEALMYCICHRDNAQASDCDKLSFASFLLFVLSRRPLCKSARRKY